MTPFQRRRIIESAIDGAWRGACVAGVIFATRLADLYFHATDEARFAGASFFLVWSFGFVVVAELIGWWTDLRGGR